MKRPVCRRCGRAMKRLLYRQGQAFVGSDYYICSGCNRVKKAPPPELIDDTPTPVAPDFDPDDVPYWDPEIRKWVRKHP